MVGIVGKRRNTVQRSSTSGGLVAALISAVTFGTSGPAVKPLLEAGWSPAAAVTVRALSAGALLLPLAVWSMRGRWSALWRARLRILGMGLIGVALTQLAYFAAIQTIPVSTALLVEFLAPLLLVGFTWASTQRMPRPSVLIGSALAVGGLILVIGPGALQVVDPVGLAAAFAAAIGCAVYFFVAARPSDDLPAVALAAFGLLLGGLLLALLGAVGVLSFTATFTDLPLFGTNAPWWVPLLLLALVAGALAYAAGITAAALLGSRVASFIGLLEVVFASIFAWLLLDERLSLLQLLGGAMILGGIAAVRTEPAEFPAGAEPGGSKNPVGVGR
jgi:drug/metabolite transporter (DMT)-like permease